MKNEIFLIISLIFLGVGITGIFFSGDILEKMNVKKKSNNVRVCKAVGFVICLIALGLMYFLER
ncbi:MAG: hypothetical protein IKV94_03220 [Clostridia bacterium]|nr:hypothetical protein [Clostridia bacterium]